MHDAHYNEESSLLQNLRSDNIASQGDIIFLWTAIYFVERVRGRPPNNFLLLNSNHLAGLSSLVKGELIALTMEDDTLLILLRETYSFCISGERAINVTIFNWDI